MLDAATLGPRGLRSGARKQRAGAQSGGRPRFCLQSASLRAESINMGCRGSIAL
jgi:hypothetical protein